MSPFDLRVVWTPLRKFFALTQFGTALRMACQKHKISTNTGQTHQNQYKTGKMRMNPHLLATLEVIRGGAEAVLELAHGLRALKVDDEEVVAPRRGELVPRDLDPAGAPGNTRKLSEQTSQAC